MGGSNNFQARKAGKFIAELDAASSTSAYDLPQCIVDCLRRFECCGYIRIKDNYVGTLAISRGVLSTNSLRKIVLRSKLEVGVVVSHFRTSFVHVALQL